MIDLTTAPILQSYPSDGWGHRRIYIVALCSVTLAGIQLILDFWSLGAPGSFKGILRDLFALSQVLLLLFLAGFVIGLVVAAGVALWRGHFRRMASSIIAIAAIPVCFVVVVKVPVFDPWLWYAMANYNRFEARAANDPSPIGLKYAVVSGADISTGLAGAGSNHFVLLIYDESDALGLDPSERPSIWQTRSSTPEGSYTPIPKGQRLYGHLFRVDEFF